LLSLVTIIYIDHKVNVKIIKQISLFIMSTKKLNLYLICASKYLQHFNLNIHHKSDKQHIVLNILLWLISIMLLKISMKKEELNALFIETYTKISDEFQRCLIEDYDEDLMWHYVIDILNKNSNKNTVNLLFKWDSNDVIWHWSLFMSDFVFKSWWLVILCLHHKNIFHIIHTQNDYLDFQYCINRL